MTTATMPEWIKEKREPLRIEAAFIIGSQFNHDTNDVTPGQVMVSIDKLTMALPHIVNKEGKNVYLGCTLVTDSGGVMIAYTAEEVIALYQNWEPA